ncbi:hypothetical protein N7537_006928 [Penicillium hordei]|uniref:Uncharacterized protein n=1 Tax=Penicillium hordei TaxID=40994 RepID=A0AAD6H4N0_9EURO|nr:uncharacterized protein N7537_006928 [Penicillium hordei]KAJ5603972.1 hypothetical protein N7537_006928 [Penicillium hordei]
MTGQSADTPFNKNDNGPEQGGDDGWESGWVSDVNEKDDYSHVTEVKKLFLELQKSRNGGENSPLWPSR